MLCEGTTEAVDVLTEETTNEQTQADHMTKTREIRRMTPIATVNPCPLSATTRAAGCRLRARNKEYPGVVFVYLYPFNLKLKVEGK